MMAARASKSIEIFSAALARFRADTCRSASSDLSSEGFILPGCCLAFEPIK